MRKEGWEERFLEVLAKHSKLPFKWGESDCAVLPMEIVEALTGSTPKTWSRDYSDAAGAAKKLRGQKVSKFEEWLEK